MIFQNGVNMSRLTISSFAKCLKDALQPPNTNEAVINLLFGWVVSKESVKDKKDDAVVITSKLVSDLFKQKANVHKAIKDYLSTQSSVEEAIAHMSEMVIPMINPVMLNDLIGKLDLMVGADESIPEEKKAELHSIKSENTPAFLANVFLYAVARQNTEEQRNATVGDILESEADRILKDSRFEGLTDIGEIVADDISRIERELSQCLKQRQRIKSVQAAISRDQEQQVKFLTLKDAEMLQRFFPEADVRKIDEIEEFHRKLAKALKDEFRQAESSMQDDLNAIDAKIAALKGKLAELGKPTNVSDAAFGRFADIQIELTNLRGANEAFFKREKLKGDKKEYQKALDALIAEITQDMKSTINGLIQETNGLIYGSEITPPLFDVKDGKKIELYTPRDAGTGTQYRGVIEFDLAMLEAADVPTLVHDSIMFKNIENQAIAGLAQAYLNASKQTFVAIDKLSSYPEIAQRVLSDAVVLSLGPDGEALFGRTWRKTEQQSSLDAQA